MAASNQKRLGVKKHLSLKKPGRPREFHENKVRESLMNLFWDKGYEGTSLSDIMNVTGLAKASLYGTFKDKRGMYEAALSAYLNGPLAALRRDLTGDKAPARSRLDDFLSAAIDGDDATRRRGCFLCRAAHDQAPQNDHARKLIMGGMNQLHQDIKSVLDEIGAKQAGDMASSYLALHMGLRALASTGAPPENLQKVKALALRGL